MSAIDEIMGHINDALFSRLVIEQTDIRDLIASAIANARREGAEQMREAAAAEFDYLESNDFSEPTDPAAVVRALPLPTGPRVGLPAADYKQGDGSKNCMQCAVAYMLGLPVEAIPDFEREHSPQRTAWERMEEFFESHGYTVEMFPPNVEITGDYLASGTTSRGTSHMVVMRGGELLHDPHPSNAGLQSIQVAWLIARRAGPSAEFTGPRQAVRLTDEWIVQQVCDGFGATTNHWASHVEFARAIESAVLAANGIGDSNA